MVIPIEVQAPIRKRRHLPLQDLSEVALHFMEFFTQVPLFSTNKSHIS